MFRKTASRCRLLLHAGRDRRVFHFIDNASALASIVKGYSSSNDSARTVVHSFWALVSGLSADVWMVYVRSEAKT